MWLRAVPVVAWRAPVLVVADLGVGDSSGGGSSLVDEVKDVLALWLWAETRGRAWVCVVRCGVGGWHWSVPGGTRAAIMSTHGERSASVAGGIGVCGILWGVGPAGSGG